MLDLASLTAMSTTEAATTTAPGWVADDQTFGARLALIRQRMGWGNIAKAAKECGVPTDSWRNWEVDGREPHRLTTIGMTIASRTGCDYLWLVHGPDRGGAVRTSSYLPEARVIAAIRPGMASTVLTGHSTDRGRSHTRPVRQTRPVAGVSTRPRSPATV